MVKWRDGIFDIDKVVGRQASCHLCQRSSEEESGTVVQDIACEVEVWTEEESGKILISL